MADFSQTGGGSNELRGYNPTTFNELRSIIASSALATADGIADLLHDGLIVPISTAWYTQEGVEYFTSVKDAVAAQGENIRQIYDAFRQSIQDAGAVWAEATKNEAPVMAEIQEIRMMLPVDEILPAKENGDVVIDEAAAMTVANNLPIVQQEIIDKIESINKELNAETQFIGGGQAEAIQNLFIALKDVVAKLFTFLTEGDESIQANIKKAVDKQREVAEGLASNFNEGLSA